MKVKCTEDPRDKITKEKRIQRQKRKTEKTRKHPSNTAYGDKGNASKR